jgi:hypothetical protein
MVRPAPRNGWLDRPTLPQERECRRRRPCSGGSIGAVEPEQRWESPTVLIGKYLTRHREQPLGVKTNSDAERPFRAEPFPPGRTGLRPLALPLAPFAVAIRNVRCTSTPAGRNAPIADIGVEPRSGRHCRRSAPRRWRAPDPIRSGTAPRPWHAKASRRPGGCEPNWPLD